MTQKGGGCRSSLGTPCAHGLKHGSPREVIRSKLQKEMLMSSHDAPSLGVTPSTTQEGFSLVFSYGNSWIQSWQRAETQTFMSLHPTSTAIST